MLFLLFILVAAPAGVTVAVGIGFANPNVGYFAGGANGAGTEILKTEDGGESWNVIPGIKFVRINILVLLLSPSLFQHEGNGGRCCQSLHKFAEVMFTVHSCCV